MDSDRAREEAQLAASLSGLFGAGGLLLFSPVQRLSFGLALLATMACVGFGAALFASARRRAVKEGVVHFVGFGLLLNPVLFANVVLAHFGWLRF